MKVVITRDTVANGQAVSVGDTVDVSARDGAYLIALGKAAEKVEKEKAKEATISKAVPGGKRDRK